MIFFSNSLRECRELTYRPGYSSTRGPSPRGFPTKVLFPKGYEDLHRPSTTPNIERRHSLSGVGVINLRQLQRDLPTHTFMAGAPWGDHRGSSHYPMTTTRRVRLCNSGAQTGSGSGPDRLRWASGFGRVYSSCGLGDFNGKKRQLSMRCFGMLAVIESNWKST